MGGLCAKEKVFAFSVFVLIKVWGNKEINFTKFLVKFKRFKCHPPPQIIVTLKKNHQQKYEIVKYIRGICVGNLLLCQMYIL